MERWMGGKLTQIYREKEIKRKIECVSEGKDK